MDYIWPITLMMQINFEIYNLMIFMNIDSKLYFPSPVGRSARPEPTGLFLCPKSHLKKLKKIFSKSIKPVHI